MKRFLLILGGIALCIVAAVTFIAYFAIDSHEKDKNRIKTAAARNARWQPKEPVPDAEVLEDTAASNGHGTKEDLTPQADEKAQ